MDNLSKRLEGLSPDKRMLFAKMLAVQQKQNSRVIKPVKNHDGPIPLSFSQQRHWFLEQLMPEAVHNIPHLVRLNGILKIDAIEKALNEVMRRHESLRTIYKVVDGQPSQIIEPYKPQKLLVEDISHLSQEERDVHLQAITKKEARKPFNITLGPLWRNRLLKLDNNTHVLWVTMHHIISDGWSGGIVMRECAELYKAFAEGRGNPFKDLDIQYSDFVVWQRKYFQGDILKNQLSYWKKELDGASHFTPLPIDFRRPPMQTFNGNVIEFDFPEALMEKFRELAEREGKTLFVIMISILYTLLSRYTNQSDLCVGTAVANRQRQELENLIGVFINTLVLRADLSGNPKFNEILKRVSETTIKAFDNQDLPFERLVDELNIERNVEYSPLFQVLYVQRENTMPDIEMPEITMSSVMLHTGTAQFDLSLYVTFSSEGAKGSFEYNTDLFRLETIEKMSEDFLCLCKAVASDDSIRIDELQALIPPKTLPVVITSSFTAKPAQDYLEFWLDEMNIPAQVMFTPYAQVFQMLIDPGSSLRKNSEGINIIMLRLEDWIQGQSSDLSLINLEKNVYEFLNVLDKAKIKTPSIVFLCPPSDNFKDKAANLLLLMRMEELITKRIGRMEHVDVVGYRDLNELYDVTLYNDFMADKAGHIPYTQEYFAAIGAFVARWILGICEPTKQKP